MKANELRIGNYIRRKSTQEEFKCDGFRIYYIEAESVDKDIESSFEPIEITPEWLERFELNEIRSLGVVSYFRNYGTGITELAQGLYRFYYKSNSIRNVQYIHELQNLYFAMTGEELTLKS